MIISGKDIAQNIKCDIKNIIEKECIANGKRTPSLATIIVGDNPASKLYVANKERACQEVGINAVVLHFPEDISEARLLSHIDYLNEDNTVDGILVQLPLPKHINTDKVLKEISPAKDVDGFHPDNVANLWLNQDCLVPCTPQGIMEMMDRTGITLEGKHVVVLGRSNIVGLPVAKLCLDRNATVTICHSKTQNLADITKQADVLIVAIGKPKFVTEDMVKSGAIVIDVGINRVNGKVCGDVDFDSVERKASYITPVPNGVGPMTIACLLMNTLECYKQRL